MTDNIFFPVVGGRNPLKVITANTPGGYSAHDRFSVAHGLTDDVGLPIKPSSVVIEQSSADPYETQTLAISGTPTGGHFTITFNGQTTANIAYNAAHADVQTALEALSNIGTGNVTCSGGALPGTPVVISLASGVLHGTAPALMTTTDALTGGSTPASAITVDTSLTDRTFTYVTADTLNVYLRASGAGTVTIAVA